MPASLVDKLYCFCALQERVLPLSSMADQTFWIVQFCFFLSPQCHVLWLDIFVYILTYYIRYYYNYFCQELIICTRLGSIQCPSPAFSHGIQFWVYTLSLFHVQYLKLLLFIGNNIIIHFVYIMLYVHARSWSHCNRKVEICHCCMHSHLWMTILYHTCYACAWSCDDPYLLLYLGQTWA